MKLQQVIDKVQKEGPDLVMVQGFEAITLVTSKKARVGYDVSSEFILIRDDGYSLGCQECLAEDAYVALDPKRWVIFLVMNDDRFYGMAKWPEREKLLEDANTK